MNVKKSTMVILLCILFGGIFTGSCYSLCLEERGQKRVLSSSDVKPEKIVTCVSVGKEDTLWTLASRYYTEEYQSIGELVDEIKQTNGLEDDKIYAGSHLIVPHYDNVKASHYVSLTQSK